MTVTYVSDSFNRANTTGGALGTTDTGQAWKHQFGSFDISNNQALVDGNGDGFSLYYVDCGYSNYTVQVTLAQFQDVGNTSNQGGFNFWFSGGGTYWYCEFGTAGSLNPGVKIVSNNSGVTTAVAQDSSIIAKSGDIIKLITNNGVITTFLNDNQVLQTTTQTFNITQTNVGLFQDQHGTGGINQPGMLFDNFLVTSNATAGPTEVDASTTTSSNGASSATGNVVAYTTASSESLGASNATSIVTNFSTASAMTQGLSTTTGIVTNYSSALSESQDTSIASGNVFVYGSAIGSSSGQGTTSTYSVIYASASSDSSGDTFALGETWNNGMATGDSTGSSSVTGLTIVEATAINASKSESNAMFVVLDYANAVGNASGSSTVNATTDILASAIGMSISDSMTTTATPVNAVISLQGEIIRNANLQGSILRVASLQGSVVQTIALQGGLPLAVTSQDFSMYVGQEFSFEITVLEDGKPFDLTGSTINWIVLSNVYSSTAIVSKSTSNGIVITDAKNGVFTVTLNSIDTAGKQPYSYYHQAQITDVAGNPYPVTTGALTLLASASVL